jgi:hypothetical protein
MNIKNHTGLRHIVLQGDSSEVATFAHGRTFPWYCKTLPATTGRLANYLVGFVVTIVATYAYAPGETYPDSIDWDDVARGLFESFELKNALLGKPISHNYYRGEIVGLGGFLMNGMRRPVPQPRPLFDTGTGTHTQRHDYFIPASCMLGMKGHHTAQLACLFDGATFEIKTAGSGTLPGLTVTNATIRVTAELLPEAEIRLGPGVQMVRYEKTTGATATKHIIEALGNTSSFQGVENGAGIAFLGWMSGNRGFGGSFDDASALEYVNLPFRGLDQLVTLDGLFLDYLGACSNNDQVPTKGRSYPETGGDIFAGPFATSGCLYGPRYAGDTYGVLGGSGNEAGAGFVPLVSPGRFMEASKLQSVEGTVELNAKTSGSFSGNDVFYALQYHSWTPAMQEEVFKKIIASGLANAVWGTPDLVPSTKIVNKQPAGGINRAKTRYFAMTWTPRETQPNPPAPVAK